MFSLLGVVVHLLYAQVPLQLLGTALTFWLISLRRTSTLGRGDRVLTSIPFTAATLLAGIIWAETAPLSSSLPVLFLLAIPLLVLLAGLVVSVPTTLVLAVVRIVQRRAKVGARLLLSCAVAIGLVLLVGAAVATDRPAKRTLREYVVSQAIAHPDLTSAAHDGPWNTRLPAGWRWLSFGGEVNWHGSGEHSQVTFADGMGPLSGYGYTYSVDGSLPSGAFAGYADETPVAPNWYPWSEL